MKDICESCDSFKSNGKSRLLYQRMAASGLSRKYIDAVHQRDPGHVGLAAVNDAGPGVLRNGQTTVEVFHPIQCLTRLKSAIQALFLC